MHTSIKLVFALQSLYYNFNVYAMFQNACKIYGNKMPIF